MQNTDWERRTEVPLAVLAVAFLVAYAVPILWTGLPRRWTLVCDVVTWSTWAVFLVDYLVRVATAPKRSTYFARHLLDLAIIALPMFRSLRMLRLVPLLQFVNRRAVAKLHGRIATYICSGAALLWFCSSLAVLDAERDAPGTVIDTFGDAMWWALATMTTVGYGDIYVITTEGRAVGVALMIGGIGLLGAVTGTIASWAVDVVKDEEAMAEEIPREIAVLDKRLDRIEALLARIDQLPPTTPPRDVE